MNEDYCLWMGDIAPEMNESILQNYFRFYNVYPLAIKLIKDRETNKNKNYCFIYFKDLFEANTTLNSLKGKPIPNTPLKFKLNWANYLTSTNKTIYVGNLNPSVDDLSLFNFFKKKYKSIAKAKIIADNGISKRYGFVTFKRENDYRKSLIEMNGVFFEGTYLKVREYKRKDEDENNAANDNINNDESQLNKNNLNISNSINKLNWINNANPINSIIIGINSNRDINININGKNNKFNKNSSSNNYDKTNKNINFNNDNVYIKYINNDINSYKEYNNFINSDINNINFLNNSYRNINIINNNSKVNKNKINKNPKLEILEEFDEITLKIKINESLNKMLEYYKESIQINGNRLTSKLILYLIFI